MKSNRAGLLAMFCLLGILVPNSGCARKAEIGTTPQQPPAAEHRDLLNTEKSLYSQGSEEVIIRDFFQDRRGGFFLDVGAAHYKEFSTTYYLEKHLGWSGIGVDALEEYGAEYEIHRPNTEFVAMAVTDKSGETISFFRSVSLREMSSIDRSTVEERGKRWTNDGRTTEVKVTTVTLNKLLDDRGIETIDFLSMDIESGEPAALRGFDIQRFKPRLVCIEVLEVVRAELEKYFSDNNYRRIEKYARYDDQNWYYTPDE